MSLLQLSIRLLHKENIRQSVLTALRSLLLLKPAALVSHRSFQRQIGRGLGILMQSQVHTAQNIIYNCIIFYNRLIILAVTWIG